MAATPGGRSMVEAHRGRLVALANKDAKLRLLLTEHMTFERRLDTLNSYRYLTPDEQIERRNLQKLKLARKDEMNRLLERYPQADQAPSDAPAPDEPMQH